MNVSGAVILSIVVGLLGGLLLSAADQRRPGAYDQVLEAFECRPHNTDPNRFDCRGQMTIWVPSRN